MTDSSDDLFSSAAAAPLTPDPAQVLPPAYPHHAAWGTATPLRAWQSAALEKYFTQNPRDFLAVATPGAGKTTFALTVAAELLSRRVVDRITVVAPTEHLKTQWADAAARAGIPIDPTYSGRRGPTSKDYVGVAVTYAGVATNALAHRIRTERFKTLVILDEVHHAGDALSWGDAVREAFEPAHRRLALTGTPFRSDVNPIPFVSYAPGGDGVPRSVADYTYGYAHALADHVVRPVLFMAYSGEMQWRTRAGDEIAARLGEPLTKDMTAQALRTALDPDGAWMPSVLAAADKRLTEVRRHVPDAGGLVIATDQDSARAYAALLKEHHRGEAGRRAVRREGRVQADRGVLRGRRPLDGRGADGVGGRRRAPARRRRLRHHDRHPAVLRPGGRPVRAGPQARRDRLGVPAVGAEPARVRLGDGGGARPRARPARSTTRATSSPPRTTLLAQANAAEAASDEELVPFEALGSEARFDRVLYDGGEFGHAGEVHVGSDEEMDFLGIPGLLEPDQVRDLLRHRQSERRRQQGRTSSTPEDVVRDVSTHEHLATLRRELNGLVAAWNHRTGQPHGVTHAALRKECGGPAAAVATADQLQARIDQIRDWAATRRTS